MKEPRDTVAGTAEEWGLEVRWPKPCRTQPGISEYDSRADAEEDLAECLRRGFEFVALYRRTVVTHVGEWERVDR